MTPREIFNAMQKAALRDQPTASDRALLALRALLVSFINATNSPGSISMRSMSVDQIRLLNQIDLAVGL